MIRTLSASAMALCLAFPALADRIVYEGDEAKALKCAWIISRTSAVMEQVGLISTEEMELSIAISSRMLALYVSGTERQKLAALRAVGDRRDTAGTVAEFQAQALACLRKFPVE